MAGFLLAICHYFFECYKVEYRLILSNRHYNKPPIRAAVGAVAGNERQQVIIACYGHIVFMQVCRLHKIHEARKIIRVFKVSFFRRKVIVAHIERSEHFVGISAVQRVQMNRPMRLIELRVLVGKQRAEHYGWLGADIVTIDGDVAGWSAEAGIAGGEQRSQRAGRTGEAVFEVIGGIIGEHDWVIDGRVRDAQPCGKIAVLRFAGFKVNARCAGRRGRCGNIFAQNIAVKRADKVVQNGRIRFGRRDDRRFGCLRQLHSGTQRFVLRRFLIELLLPAENRQQECKQANKKEQRNSCSNPLFHGVFSLQVHFSADALDQRTTVERGKLRKALGAEKLFKLHEVIPGFGIVFTFDVDAVKQTFIVVDSLFHNSVCQKLKAPFGNKGLEGDDRQLCCIRFRHRQPPCGK